MPSVLSSLLILCLLAQFLWAPAPAWAAPGGETPRIIVGLKPGKSGEEIASLHAGQKARVIKRVPALGLEVVQGPAGLSARELARAYSKSPLVRFAEPDDLIAPEAAPNDPNYPSQWHHTKIGSPSAWDYTTGSGVLVGICDTGVDPTHPDLTANLRGDLGYNTADDTTNWTDEYGHGTATAGTAAAAGNNATGVAGVAYQAQIIPVRISNFSDGSAYVSDATECIQYAADKGARAINLSYRMAGYSAIDAAAVYADSLGAVTLVSAGNTGTNPGWPDYPGFLAVSATNQNDMRTSWSSYGAHVDLAAPGENVLTTSNGGSYGYSSGTSFSAPAVAGVAALLFAADPSLTAAKAREILTATARDLGLPGRDYDYGAGRVDAYRAVGRAVNKVDGTVSFNGGTCCTSVTDVTLNLSAVDDTGTGVSEMRLSADGVTWSAWEPYTTSKPYSLSAGDGIKEVYAQFKNGAGNPSISTREVIILDTVPPSGTVTINGGAEYTSSPTVTLNLSGTDASSGVGVVRFSNDGASWTAWEFYTPTKSYSVPPGDGPKTVYAQFKDQAGLISEATSDSIMLDTVAPAGGTAVINGGAEYTNATTVTLTLSTADPDVTQVCFSEDGTTWSGCQAYATTVQHTLSSGEGLKTLYVQFRDAAGNGSAPTSDTITLDRTAPSGTVTINDGATYATSSTVTLTLSATDSVTAVGEMQFSTAPYDGYSEWEPYATSKSWTLSAGDGSKSVYVHFRDLAGNVQSWTISDYITVDTQPPSGSITIGSGNPAYATSATVALSVWASDSTSGTAEMRFSEDGATWTAWEPYTSSKAWTLSGGDGVKTVYAEYRDRAGHVSPTYSDSITLDSAAPGDPYILINNGAEYSTSSTVTLTLSATDAGTGLTKMCFSQDGSYYGYCPSYATTIQYTFSGEGLKTLYVKYYDAAGNISQVVSDSITVDYSGPDGTVTINDGAQYTNSPDATLTLSATDAGTSVAEMRFSHYSYDYWTAWEPYAATKPWTLQTGEGTKYVYVQFRDLVGNITNRSDYITLDSKPPTGTISINSGNPAYTASPAVTLYLSASDTAGVADMRFSEDGATWTAWEPYASQKAWTLTGGEGLKMLYVEYRDKVGLSSTLSDSITLDSGAPAVTGSTPADGAQVQSLSSLAITLADASSGVDEKNTVIAATKDDVSFTGFTRDNSVDGKITLAITVPAAGTYAFTVTPQDNAGNAGSPVMLTITDVGSVGAPSNLAATVSGSNVALSWTDSSGNETAFVVERATKLKSGGVTAYSAIGTVASPSPAGTGGTVSFTDQSVPTGTYLYRVKAVNDTLSSGYSAEVQVRVR